MGMQFQSTISVSFPRCGFALIHNAVVKYFCSHEEVKQFRVCYPQNERVDKKNLKLRCYVDLYSDLVPDEEIDFDLLKTHDFVTKEIDVVKCDNFQYLLPFREPLASLVSNYKLHKAAREAFGRPAMPWEPYASWQVEVWNKFMEKWFFWDNPKLLRVNYDDLVREPVTALRKVIEFLSPELRFSPAILDETIRGLDVRYRSTLNDFVEYDEEIFSQLKSMTVWDRVTASRFFPNQQ